MGIYHGLYHLACQEGYPKVVCYSDSSNVVNLVLKGVSHHHRFNIKDLLSQGWECNIRHTLYEGNHMCTNFRIFRFEIVCPKTDSKSKYKINKKTNWTKHPLH